MILKLNTLKTGEELLTKRPSRLKVRGGNKVKAVVMADPKAVKVYQALSKVPLLIFLGKNTSRNKRLIDKLSRTLKRVTSPSAKPTKKASLIRSLLKILKPGNQN